MSRSERVLWETERRGNGRRRERKGGGGVFDISLVSLLVNLNIPLLALHIMGLYNKICSHCCLQLDAVESLCVGFPLAVNLCCLPGTLNLVSWPLCSECSS